MEMQRVHHLVILFRLAEDDRALWHLAGQLARSIQRAQRRLASDAPERLKAADEALIAERFRALGKRRRLVRDGLN